MRRKLVLLSAGVAVVAVLLFALGSQTPAAHADDSSMSWDVVMYECPDLTNDKCAYAPPANAHCTYDDPVPDGLIETGECPDVEANMWFQTAQTAVSDEPSADLANIIWTVDGSQVSTTQDLDGDTSADPGYVIPANGLRATPGELMKHGATVGRIDFKVQSNIIPASVVFAKNIDDVAATADTTVRGQMAVCDVAPPRVVMTDSFDTWNSSRGPFVVSNDETQSDNYSEGEDCSQPGGTANGMYDGIDCMPEGVIAMLNVSGFGPYLEGRAYGIAELQITESITIPIDINFLWFNLLAEPEVQGYMTNTLILYPHMPSPDPSDPDYDSIAQTLLTCPPFTVAPQHQYGVTQDSDFSLGVPSPDAHVDGGEINRQVMGTGGPFNYYVNKSTQEDYDGDTIAGIYDRCDTDPATGSAAQDLDGDTLTGTCDPFEDDACPVDQTKGCPAGNPQDTAPPGWNTAPPWDSGQDADGDTYVNAADNCPNHANGAGDPNPQMDTDHDGVGDTCDPEPYIGGDGDGYPGSAGTYLEHDNRCIDQFSIGAAEPRGEAGAVPGKYCYVNEATFATTVPYVNLPLASLNIAYNDSNDDGDPDWADLNGDTVYQIGEPIDTDSNTDNPAAAPTTDYESDACEAVNGTDPLDPSVNSGSGCAALMDCDGDRVSDADEEAAATNPFNAASFPDEITKAIVSAEIDGDWYQVGDEPAWCPDDDPLPAGVPALPHAAPPAEVQADVCVNQILTTDDLDWSSAEIWIDKTAVLQVVAGNCDIGDFLDEPKEPGRIIATQVVNEFEPQGWSTEPDQILWDIHLLDDGGCTLHYTVTKEIKSPPDPPDLTFDPQTVVLTINVIETRACVFAGDVDCDACYDTAEPGLTPPADPADAWDFYDVPVPTLGSGGHISGDPSGTDSRDHAISIINDVLAVLEYAGTSDGGPANAAGRQYNQDVNSDTVNDGIAYDRSVPATRSGAPDGAVSIIVDVLLVLAQAGQFCSPP